ncbi:hypothetical protein BWI17_14755 [Betaproteobacteria bacterium GR16-43]|nr:hypothetical protein BWI17_14755 [Betaproteobacteria bacterium GR16-43]
MITDPKFRRTGLTEDARREFFASGEVHVRYVSDMIREYLGADFHARSVLDFGCGVGRLLIPFARVTDEAYGLDVSPSMIEEARRNCETQGVANARLLVSTDDGLAALGRKFDLVHSYIVFQHIPPARGLPIFAALVDLVAPGGVGALHVTYAKAYHAETNGRAPPPAPGAPVPATPASDPAADPEMQMNAYDVNPLLFTLQRRGVHRFHTEFTDHGGELGLFLFFRKPLEP